MSYYIRQGSETANSFIFSMFEPWGEEYTHTRPWSEWDVQSLTDILERGCMASNWGYNCEEMIKMSRALDSIQRDLEEAKKELEIE